MSGTPSTRSRVGQKAGSPSKRAADMTPEQHAAKKARDKERDAWRSVHRLYLKVLDQRRG